jgi:hypothetical protein
MSLFSRDTRARAEQVQIQSYRSMTGDARYRLSVEMSDNVRDIALDRLRSKNPGLSQQAVMNMFLRSVMGWNLPGTSRGSFGT